MKLLIAFAALVTMALAALAGDEVNAAVLKFDSDVGVDGYKFAYDTSNGIRHQESGQLKSIADAAAVVVTGTYTYTAPDGQTITLNYVADENGFHPEGAHLPQI
ncbi:larval cuticle protein 65Ag1-like [Wyeomyia smithii]|uniref:larval cuticle protein 65Ag1-like n=1 Tax=Wyeomyia smithii TaxID=174621 RepID=UPI002467F4EA|nr:larval cuticle protein 65Ag1-like [Wyeomyia smithii]